jgi:hypothetical protein
MLRIILLMALFVISIPANAEISLKPIHPDEPTEYTYNKRFSTENSLECLSRIRSALESFRKLTEATDAKIAMGVLTNVGNTGWETQNLGFMNWPGTIEGTLYKNEYIIRKLEYELTMEKVKSGQLINSDLEKAEKDYKQAEQNFIIFWNSFGIGD